MNKRPHICILTSSDISQGGIGGDGRYSILLYSWLKNKNINTTLLGSYSLKIRNYNPSNNVKSTPKKNILGKKISFAPYPLFMVKRILISIILSIKIIHLHYSLPISLIHAQDTGYTGLAAIFVGRILKVPVVVSSHGIRHKTIDNALNSKIKGIIYKIERDLDMFTIKRADGVVVDNDAIKSYFEKIVKEKIDSIPIPIRTDKFVYSLSARIAIRNELGIDQDTNIIGFIGRLAPEKNLINLITAFSNVLRNSHRTKLLLVGSGPLESQMKNLVDDMNISDNVIFYGVSNDVSKILSACEIFILPSFAEGMSVALLEAMATGVPIICSKIPTNAEIISDRKEGILIDPHNIHEIENSIIELLEDSMLRSELSNNAKKKVLQFDVNNVFPKLVQFYGSYLGKSLI
jgi:glycosyltransferase involved in cell wall biosynthesis